MRLCRTKKLLMHNFLWFDLRCTRSILYFTNCCRYYNFYSAKNFNGGMDQSTNPQMAMMLWMMPIMIVVFAVNFPAALSLYWVVGNIFMIVQTYFIKGPDLKEAAAGKAGGAKKSETNNCYRTNCRRSSRISFSSTKYNRRSRRYCH